MKNFLKTVSVYVGAFFFLAQHTCVAYILLLFKYAFVCISNTGRHIRIPYQILQQDGNIIKSVSNKRNQILYIK